MIHRVHSTMKVAAVVCAACFLTAGTLVEARSSEPADSEYAMAVQSVVQKAWMQGGHAAATAPGSRCAARITQIPGGELLSLDFHPDCDFDEIGRTAIAETVYRSAPFPYHGFGEVFEREIRMVFHGPGVDGYRARDPDRVATRRVQDRNSESSRRSLTHMDDSLRQEEYMRQCSFRLWWEMPKVELQRPVAVMTTVDRSGEVVNVVGVWGEPVLDQLAAALRATPCEPVPADLFVGADSVDVGPILVRLRKN